MIPPLDWKDEAAVKAWALALRSRIDDGLEAGLDATAPKRDRTLARHDAREKLQEAKRWVDDAYAYAGLEANDTRPRATESASREAGAA